MPDDGYAASLEVDYPDELNRLTTVFRLIWVIPIAIVFSLISGGTSSTYVFISAETGETLETVTTTGGGILASISFAVLLMILFRQRYPRWWFDFVLELTRFGARVLMYLALATDQYPATEDEQAIHLNVEFPDVKNDLNRWMPIVKWFLAIPHYVVLAFLFVGAFFTVVIAWFAILFTGRYPRGLFNYVVGVARWSLRVEAYMFLLATDEYPPFSLH